MRRSTGNRSSAVVVLALAAAVGIFGAASASTAVNPTYVCVNKANELRLSSASAKCAGGWTKYVVAAQGPAGISGKNGIDGKNGANGKDGAPGKDGLNGKDGVSGEDGLPGKDGLNGKDGLPGAKGDTGAAGSAGATGAIGPVGPQGLPGADGKDGANAFQLAAANGFTGNLTDWLAGLKGDKGDPGLAGIQGTKGDQGLMGAQGLKGDRGDAGPAGSTGPQGPVGLTGPQGATGPQGPAGSISNLGISVVEVISANSTTSPKSVTPMCPTGSYAIGWGTYSTSTITANSEVDVVNGRPVAMTITARVSSGQFQFAGQVICLSLGG